MRFTDAELESFIMRIQSVLLERSTIHGETGEPGKELCGESVLLLTIAQGMQAVQDLRKGVSGTQQALTKLSNMAANVEYLGVRLSDMLYKEIQDKIGHDLPPGLIGRGIPLATAKSHYKEATTKEDMETILESIKTKKDPGRALN